MIRDLEHFQSRLGNIDGFGDTGEQLMTIVKSKDVETTPPPAAESKDAADEGSQKGAATEDGTAEADKVGAGKEATETESK